MFEYTLKRSNRKTVAIHIRDGSVEVRAPLKIPQSGIDKFVASKEKWIREKLASSTERKEMRSSFSVDYGDLLRYRGKMYPVVARIGDRMGFDDEGFYLPENLTQEQIKYAIIEIYKRLAKRDLVNRVLFFAEKMQCEPTAVKVNSAKTRWGSCSGKKSINFSWILIMADDDIIDYIVVHELAHIFEMNHSAKFWKVVERFIVDYNELRARLRLLQKQLSVEDWV